MKEIVIYSNHMEEDPDIFDVIDEATVYGAYTDTLEEAKKYVEREYEQPEKMRYFKVTIEEVGKDKK